MFHELTAAPTLPLTLPAAPGARAMRRREPDGKLVPVSEDMGADGANATTASGMADASSMVDSPERARAATDASAARARDSVAPGMDVSLGGMGIGEDGAAPHAAEGKLATPSAFNPARDVEQSALQMDMDMDMDMDVSVVRYGLMVCFGKSEGCKLQSVGRSSQPAHGFSHQPN